MLLARPIPSEIESIRECESNVTKRPRTEMDEAQSNLTNSKHIKQSLFSNAYILRIYIYQKATW